ASQMLFRIRMIHRTAEEDKEQIPQFGSEALHLILGGLESPEGSTVWHVALCLDSCLPGRRIGFLPALQQIGQGLPKRTFPAGHRHPLSWRVRVVHRPCTWR